MLRYILYHKGAKTANYIFKDFLIFTYNNRPNNKHQTAWESELGKGTEFSIQIPIVQQRLSRVVNLEANNLALETVGVN